MFRELPLEPPLAYANLGRVCLQNNEIGRAASNSPTFHRHVVQLLRTHMQAGMAFVNYFMGHRCHAVSRSLDIGHYQAWRGGVSMPSWYLQSLGTATTSIRTDVLLGNPAKMGRIVV